jgi:hypothetical protein
VPRRRKRARAVESVEEESSPRYGSSEAVPRLGLPALVVPEITLDRLYVSDGKGGFLKGEVEWTMAGEVRFAFRPVETLEG